jgi:nicotinate-nucleotide pyrophosphorylase (carboxylating)
MQIQKNYIEKSVRKAIIEDLGKKDITSNLIFKKSYATAKIIFKEISVLCGKPWIDSFPNFFPSLRLKWNYNDGDLIKKNSAVVVIKGLQKEILMAERVMINYLQSMSGIATKTNSYVKKTKKFGVKVFDTRKTIPLFRYESKYAVQVGGGFNHRMGLYDGILIKENHLKYVKNLKTFFKKVRDSHPNNEIITEIENLQQLYSAINYIDVALLDNMNLNKIKKAVKINKERIQLEVSGNVSLKNVEEIARTKVDRISIGDLTKNIKSVDISLLI